MPRWVRTLAEVALAVVLVTGTVLVTADWLAVTTGNGAESLSTGSVVAAGLSAAIATALILLRASARRIREHTLARRRSAIELDEVRKLLTEILRVVPAGVFVLDRDLRVLLANSTTREVHGTEDPVGRLCHDVYAAGSECKGCPASEAFATGEAVYREGYQQLAGTEEVVSQQAYPLTLPDGKDYTIVVEKVVTEQQKMQVSLVHQEKMAAYGLMAAGIAHDMGNPLSSIQMHLQMIDDGTLPGDVAESLSFVREEVARLHRGVRELVDFARRRRADAALISVQSVVADSLKLLRYDRRMRGVDVTVHADPETPPVHLVEDHLMQVVVNLLVNSLDAIEAVEDVETGGKIRIEILPVGGRVVLRIHDDGAGMEPHVLERCCDALFSTKKEGRGTGLGLSVSGDILRAAGGALELHSTRRKGTTAVVTLPAADGARASAPAEAAPTPPGPTPSIVAARTGAAVSGATETVTPQPAPPADPGSSPSTVPPAGPTPVRGAA